MSPHDLALHPPAEPLGHLVLSRRDHESIMIGDDIEITVVAVQGDAVRLGIVAPRDVRILRRELWAPGERSSAASHIRA